MNELNISKILKHAPKGLKLYSPLVGPVKFSRVNGVNCIEVKTVEKGILHRFHPDGRYWTDEGSECLLFPSKEVRNWDNWAEVFSKDPVAMGCCIHMNVADCEMIASGTHYCKDGSNGTIATSNYFNDWASCFASPDETDRFLKKFRESGFEYDIVTHSVRHIKSSPKHYAIANLKATDYVLVRDGNSGRWQLDIFSHYEDDEAYHFVCIGDSWMQCIPYSENRHLLNTKNMPSEEYINW